MCILTCLFGVDTKKGCHSIVRRCCKKEDSPLQSFAVKIIAYKDPEYLFEVDDLFVVICNSFVNDYVCVWQW